MRRIIARDARGRGGDDPYLAPLSPLSLGPFMQFKELLDGREALRLWGRHLRPTRDVSLQGERPNVQGGSLPCECNEPQLHGDVVQDGLRSLNVDRDGDYFRGRASWLCGRIGHGFGCWRVVGYAKLAG